MVRNMRAVLKKASWGTRRIFRGIRCKKQASTVRDIRCQKQPSLVRDASSKVRRTADSTDCRQPPTAPDASSVRETAPALFVRSGPFQHFLRPANAELVSGGPFPCSFDGTRYQRRPPLGCEQTQKKVRPERNAPLLSYLA